jgi:hypothetical protein
MSRKVLSIVVPVVIVAVVVGVIAFVAIQDKGGADALTVNGRSVSQVTVNNELRALTTIQGNQPSAPGAISSAGSAAWLTNRVTVVAMQEVLHRRGVELTTAELEQGSRQAKKQLPQLPDSAVTPAVVFTLGYSRLTAELGSQDAVTRVLKRQMRLLDVSVDPKYGRWVRARAEVCAWTGCPSAQSSSDSGTG